MVLADNPGNAMTGQFQANPIWRAKEILVIAY